MLGGELAAAEEVHRTRRALVEEQNGVVTEVRVRAAEAKQRVEGDQAVGRTPAALAARAERARGAARREDVREFARQQGELAGRVARDREQLGDRVAEALQLTRSGQRAQERATRRRARGLAEQEQGLRGVRMTIEAESKLQSELEPRRARSR